jgi:hypothetical protein
MTIPPHVAGPNPRFPAGAAGARLEGVDSGDVRAFFERVSGQ